MKAILVICCLLFIRPYGIPAQADTTSIHNLLRNAIDTQAIAPDIALDLANRAIDLSDRISYRRGKAQAEKVIGKIEFRKSNWNKAYKHYLTALTLWEDIGDQYEIALLHYDISFLLEQSGGDLKEALERLNVSKKILQDLGDSKNLAEVFNVFGHVYKALGQYKFAEENYQEAMAIHMAAKNEEGIAMMHYGFGNLYFAEGRYEEALARGKLAANSFEELTLYKESALAHNLIGTIHMDLMQDELAKVNLQKSIEFAKQSEEPGQMLFDALINLSFITYFEKNYAEAIKLARQAEAAVGEQIGADDKIVLIQHLGDIYQHQEQLDSAIIYKDSLRVLEHKNFNSQLADAAKKYETLEVRQQLLETKTKAQRSRVLFLGIIGATLIGLLIFALFYLRSQQKRKFDAIQHEQEIDELISDQKQKTIDARMDGQLAERKDIAKKIHDGVGAQIAAAKWMLEATVDDFEEKSMSTSPLEAVLNILNKNYRALRNIVKQLERSDVNWLHDIQEFVKLISTNRKLEIEFHTHGLADGIDQKMGQEVSNIVMELIANTLKHAKAKSLTIQINKFDQELNLNIEDDGKGFDTKRVVEGSGLRNIRERVMNLNGSTFIDSTPGKGTTTNIIIPIN